MPEISTSRIFTYESSIGISTRPGYVELDSAEHIDDEDGPRDAQRPLHVSGLRDHDVFVFLDIDAINVGYIVGSTIESEGSGVIVPGDSVLHDDKTYLGLEMAERLADLDFPTLAEFGLQSLARAAHNRRMH